MAYQLNKLMIDLQASLVFQDCPYFRPYRRYLSKILRCPLIAAHFMRKFKISGFLARSTSDVAYIFEKERR